MIQKKLRLDNAENAKVEINRNSQNYPCLLNNIKNSPENLFVKGNIEILNMPSVAIVGTRRPTNEGRIAAKKIAKYYGENGFVIVSGLAMGIDSLAMETALAVEAPVIGVLPSSLDNIVPKKNVPLAKQVLKQNGLLISENKEDNVQKYHYINRNRIISGISMMVIVVETAAKGGTMHTVEFAKDQKRPILVADLPAEGNVKLKEESYPLISV